MNFFFELLKNRAGFSRIGRMYLSRTDDKYVRTPNILIPIKEILMRHFNFIEEFEHHNLFLISERKYIKHRFIESTFKNVGIIFAYNGMLERFQRIIEEKKDYFSENKILAVIPFNVPTTSVNYEFAKHEINHYLDLVRRFLSENADQNFGLSIRLFNYPELIKEYIPLIKEFNNIRLLNINDLFDEFFNFREIIKVISIIKKDLDNNLVLMASGKILSKYYPILVYLGIDIIDSSYMLHLASENFYDSREFLLPIYKIKYFPCSCVACSNFLKDLKDEKYSSNKIDFLGLHNLISSATYMKKIKQYLRYEDFRGFVEKSTFDDTLLISMLRILDRDYLSQVRYFNPINLKDTEIKCFGPISYHRPDIEMFRNRVTEEFIPEPWTKLLLLFPCSATKPYSQSRSHRRFQDITRGFSEFPSFQEFILTSPLGAIPRQLENIYPVNSYDIPVTGDWDQEEIKIAGDMLKKLISKYPESIPVICHLEEGYKDIAVHAQEGLNHKFYYTDIHKGMTDKESLESLRNLLEKHTRQPKNKEKIQRFGHYFGTWNRKLTKIVDYQFGKQSGRELLSNELKLKRDRHNTRMDILLRDSKQKLGEFKFSIGQVKLTLLGAEKLDKERISKYIIFDGESIRGNTLFRPGIKEWDQNLVPHDQVIIFDKDKKEVIGTGRMIIGSKSIKKTESGRVVKLYETR
ncbi:MAG: Archaeosine synthase [Promethearchaeota archaeon]|nr:MAG: Archaeosine synthase [Candidatus Lokiarchaeota archaeon]